MTAAAAHLARAARAAPEEAELPPVLGESQEDDERTGQDDEGSSGLDQRAEQHGAAPFPRAAGPDPADASSVARAIARSKPPRGSRSMKVDPSVQPGTGISRSAARLHLAPGGFHAG